MCEKDTHEILPYEEVVKILDQHDYFTVSICPCKHRRNIDPDFDCGLCVKRCPMEALHLELCETMAKRGFLSTHKRARKNNSGNQRGN